MPLFCISNHVFPLYLTINKNSLFSRIIRSCFPRSKRRKEASSYTPRASVTVETALVLPVFLAGLLLFLYFFQVLYLNICVEKAVYEVDHMISTVSMQEKAVSLVEGQLPILIRKRLESYGCHTQQYTGKTLHVSQIQDDGVSVVYTVSCQVKAPVHMLGFKGVTIRRSSRVRKWIGDRDDQENGTGLYVYVAENGRVYHKSQGCTHLKLSIRMAGREEVSSLRNQEGGKYYPCEVCWKINNTQEEVFIAKEGNRFHSTLACGGLKRTIYRIRIGEVGDMPRCSKCWKGEK